MGRIIHSAVVALLALVAAGAVAQTPDPAGARLRLEAAADRLLPLLDLDRQDLRRVRDCAAGGDKAEALRLWRDQLVTRLRSLDYDPFYQHDYARHPRQVGIVDRLAGVVSRTDYLKDASKIGFLDIFDMAGAPDRKHRIDWFAQPEDVQDWGNPEIAAWSLDKKRTLIAYDGLHVGRSFVARYWETGNPVYRDKWLQIADDFVTHHGRQFWEAYRRGEVHTRNQDVGRRFYVDWRENVNALDTAVRARNLVVFQAGLAKCLGDDKPATWADILRPVQGALTREQMEALPADQMANAAVSLVEAHGAKVIWFVSGPAVPNQRLTGLKTLLTLALTYPEFRHAPALEIAFRVNLDKVLDDNYLPDGGNLEQSFNYNHGELRELEVILGMFGSELPPFAAKLQDRVQARRAMDDGLRTPLGGLPQVGNHSSFMATGKDIGSSPQALERYRAYCRETGQLAEPEPQSYLSQGYPYSGYYAMRGGWGMTAPYLFFMAGRPQSGHAMHDANSIQVTAHGRNLIVCDGPPTYGYRHTPETEYASFAVEEECGWKVNTVLVDGLCQARDETSYSRAPQTPVRCRWHTGATFDLVENLCDRGYWQAQKPHGKPDHSVTHQRTVIFLRAAGFWVVEDRMRRSDDTRRTYAQVWNFPPKLAGEDYARQRLDGFAPEQFELQPEQKRFATADPTGPNVEFLHVTPGAVAYRLYYGDREALKGWFAPGLGSLCAAPDVHAEWQSTDSDVLVTLIVPRDRAGISPLTEVRRLSGAGWFGFDGGLRDGGRLAYRTAAAAGELRSDPVAATGTTLLAWYPAPGAVHRVVGIVAGASGLAVAGRALPLDDSWVEFAVGQAGAVDLLPIPQQRSPRIVDPPPFLATEPVPDLQIEGAAGFDIRYSLDGSEPQATSPLYAGPVALATPAIVRARYCRGDQVLPLVACREHLPSPYPPRPADYPLTTPLANGLRCAEILDQKPCRLYDLMRQEPTRTGERSTWQLAEYATRTNYGLRQTGVLRIPRGGFWRFHLKRGEAATAGIVIRNPLKDLPSAPLVSVGWWAAEQSGSIALEAGFHGLEIQYGCFYNPRNGLEIEVEGPGTSRQPLPDAWLFLDPHGT